MGEYFHYPYNFIKWWSIDFLLLIPCHYRAIVKCKTIENIHGFNWTPFAKLFEKYCSDWRFEPSTTRGHSSMQGRPKTCERPGQAIHLAPLRTEPIFFNVFGLERGWRTFLRARALIKNNFRRNSFACGKPEFTSTIFPIMPMTPSRPL